MDTQSMLAVLHHNSNIDAEDCGDRVEIKESMRIGRANDQPNPRIH